MMREAIEAWEAEGGGLKGKSLKVQPNPVS